MKTRVLIPAISLLSPLSLTLAQQPPPAQHQLSMQIENVASGGTQKGHVVADDSSTTSRQSLGSAPRYKVEVRNFSPNADKVLLEWYVFARPVGSTANTPSKLNSPARLYIHDKGSEAVGLEPRKSVTRFFQPKPIIISTESKSTVFNSPLPGGTSISGSSQAIVSSTREQSGAKMAGWLVRLVADGKLIGIKASQPTLEQIGRDSKVLEAMESESPVKRGR